MGKRIKLNVKADHVESLTHTSPVRALEELIWNALDADAEHVIVTIKPNDIGGIEKIIVEDDGLGIEPETSDDTFGSLGGSLKKAGARTPLGRTVHGSQGQGRYRAFALGHTIEWTSRVANAKGVREWTIKGQSKDLTDLGGSDPALLKGKAPTGTVVTIEDVIPKLATVASDRVMNELLAKLATYLVQYRSISVVFDGKRLEPKAVQNSDVTYDVQVENSVMRGKLTIVDWAIPVPHKIYLCNSEGLARVERDAHVASYGTNFTAYITTHDVDSVPSAELDVADLLPHYQALFRAARDRVTEHFREIEAARIHDSLKDLKDQGLYPYEGEATTSMGKVERDLFDICAVQIRERMPDFDDLEAKSKKLTLRLVKEALETRPSSLQTILREVLGLPASVHDDLAELLHRHKLESLIRASKIVSDRLHFLDDLRHILFDTEWKRKLKERTQLQEILVKDLWIFGDQYHLGTDDKNLRNVLIKHLDILGRDELAKQIEVQDGDGLDVIPDLMLYRQIVFELGAPYEHLVIELKRPSVKIGAKEIQQIETYAYKVQSDGRFSTSTTRWKFVLVSTEFDDFAEQKAKQKDREYGHISSDAVDIWIMKWSDVITRAEWKMRFYRDHFEHEASSSEGAAVLVQKHAEILKMKPESATGKRGKRPSKSAADTITAFDTPPPETAEQADAEVVAVGPSSNAVVIQEPEQLPLIEVAEPKKPEGA